MINTNEKFVISIEEVTENISIDVTTGSSGTNNYNDLLNTPDLSIYAEDTDLIPKANTTYVDTQDSALEGRILTLENTKSDTTYVDTAKAQAIASANAYTDSEIAAIPSTDISGKADITYVDTGLSGKVDKVTGKVLTDNNFSDAQVIKVTNSESVTGAQAKADAAEASANVYSDAGDAALQTNIDAKVDKVAGKVLSDNNFTNVQVGIVTNAESVTGSQNKADAAETAANAYTDTGLSSKVDIVAGKDLSDNNFTDAQVTIVTNAESVTGAQAKADAAEANANTYTDTVATSKVDKVAGKELSDSNYTQAEKDKLAGIEGSKFKGTYVSVPALETAHPTSEEGAYAHVDGGATSKVELYIWDNTDAKWEISYAESTAITSAQVKTKYEENPDTNAYTDTEKTKVGSLPTNVESTEGAQTKANAAESAANTYTDTGLAGKEPTFTKNTAFNKSFGTAVDTIAQGNDSRIINGQTAFGWGDHSLAGYVTTDTDTTYTAGTDMSLVGTTFNNTAPDQTVVLTPGGATSITGTYPNFTISSTDTNTDTTYTSSNGILLTGSNFTPTYGTGVDTIAQGNDSRILNGGTAFGWGDHSIQGYLTTLPVHNHDTLYYTKTQVDTALDGKVDDAQVLTNVPAGALFTDTVYDDTTIQGEVDLNTAKVSNVDHPLVETAVPVGAVFTDTVYDDTAIQADVDSKLAKETNIQGFWRGTQAAYDALTPDDNTIYFIE